MKRDIYGQFNILCCRYIRCSNVLGQHVYEGQLATPNVSETGHEAVYIAQFFVSTGMFDANPNFLG